MKVNYLNLGLSFGHCSFYLFCKIIDKGLLYSYIHKVTNSLYSVCEYRTCFFLFFLSFNFVSILP